MTHKKLKDCRGLLLLDPHKWKKFQYPEEVKDRVRICKKCGLILKRDSIGGQGWCDPQIATLEEVKPIIERILRDQTSTFLKKRSDTIFDDVTTSQKEREKALTFLDRMYEEIFALKKCKPLDTAWDQIKKKWIQDILDGKDPEYKEE